MEMVVFQGTLLLNARTIAPNGDVNVDNPKSKANP